MTFFVIAIVGNLGDILILVLSPILACLFLCRSNIGLESKSTIFLPITVLLNLVELLFLVFPSFFRDFGPLFNLTISILVLALTLESCAAF